MANTKEKVEAKAAVEEVQKADDKVAEIKAEKAAKKAERQAKRETWKGPLKVLGKGINWCENNPGPATACFLTGTGVGWVAKHCYEKYISKKKETAEETPLLEEVNEAPFDTEA